ncbi:MAG: hypothetical protein IPI68_02330 [Chitinophagaceae bacterium]|nr:hypothetical protein [Chitinophagaceae bacterium]
MAFCISNSANDVEYFEVTPNFGAGTQAIGALTSLPIAAYASPPNNVAQQGFWYGY